jgi:polar amino acid transport system permease protein
MLELIREYGMLLLIGQYPHGPMGGLTLTLIVAGLGLLGAFPLALLLALGKLSRFAGFALPCKALINFVRAMPALMLVFWAYFVLPKVTGGAVSGFWTLVFALVIYIAAYMAEVIRGGIEALPSGQFEAARALGGGYWVAMTKVILPQALFHVMPGLLSLCVSIVKETSLGFIIGINEVTFAANQVNTLTMTRPLEVFCILAIIYFTVCFSLTRVLGGLETHIRRKRGEGA